MDRENISKTDAINRINSQLPDEEVIKFATHVIKNNDSYNKLKDTVESLLPSWKNKGD